MSSIEHANPCSSSAHVQHAAAMHSDIAVVDANGRLFSWNWAADGLVPHPQEGVLRLQGRYITHLSASTLRGTVLSTSAVQREGGVALLSTWSDDVLHRFCAAETYTSVMDAPEVSPAFLHFPLHHHCWRCSVAHASSCNGRSIGFGVQLQPDDSWVRLECGMLCSIATSASGKAFWWGIRESPAVAVEEPSLQVGMPVTRKEQPVGAVCVAHTDRGVCIGRVTGTGSREWSSNCVKFTLSASVSS